MKRLGLAAVLIGVAGLMALTASVAMGSTPRWVKHVHRYPGGISNGVRAYLDPGMRKAKKQARASQELSSPAAPAAPGPLQNIQVNSQDSNPPLPQNETQVVHSELNDNIAVAGANDYVNGGSQIYTTSDGGQTWSTQYRSSQTLETGDFCGGGGDPALTYSLRDHAF